MIAEWIESYDPKNRDDYEQAMREIMQQIALAGLSRAGFYNKAAFYGGTALRIFYNLDRFSEDMDFSLMGKNMDFNLSTYLEAVKNEFSSIGMNVSASIKKKQKASDIESAFLKPETIWSEIILQNTVAQMGLDRTISVKIKLEVDTDPPLGFGTEEHLMIRPYSFFVRCFQIQDLFAGKMHALLYRKWKSNVKGRDWYDLEWYIRRGTSLNLQHFVLRAIDSGDWTKESMTEAEFRTLLAERIDQINMERAKDDIKRFIKDPKVLDIWSPSYFHKLVEQLKINSNQS